MQKKEPEKRTLLIFAYKTTIYARRECKIRLFYD